MTDFTVSRGREFSHLFLPFDAMNEIGMQSWNALGQLVEVAGAQGLLSDKSTAERTPVPGGWNLIAPNEHFEVLSGIANAAVRGNYSPLVALRDGKAAPASDY